MPLFIGFLLVSTLLADVRFVPHPISIPHASKGALVDGTTLYSWGAGLSRADLLSGRSQMLSKEQFGPAGCGADIDSDGALDLVLHALPDRLVWLRGPHFNRMSTIDSGANFADCLHATLLGRRGILLTHRGMQVRFYEAPNPLAAGRWPYREIYSFYTPSDQAGLVIHDVDGDGRPDLVSGNYWIQSPQSFELPWRLFAINTYNDTPRAAHLRTALLPSPGGIALLVSQRILFPARLALFRPPADPKQLWMEQRLEGDLSLNEPAGLAAADMDGDGLADFVLAENGGAKPRVWFWQRKRDGSFHPRIIHAGSSVHSVFLNERDGDGRLDIIAVGPERSFWFQNLPVR